MKCKTYPFSEFMCIFRMYDPFDFYFLILLFITKRPIYTVLADVVTVGSEPRGLISLTKASHHCLLITINTLIKGQLSCIVGWHTDNFITRTSWGEPWMDLSLVFEVVPQTGLHQATWELQTLCEDLGLFVLLVCLTNGVFLLTFLLTLYPCVVSHGFVSLGLRGVE